LKVFEYFQDKEKIYLVTELCDGKELFEEINNRRKTGWEESEAAPIIEQLVSSLSYLHSNNIVHRDIKPENIIVDSLGQMKLIDFGTAQKFKPGRKMKQTFGTSYYIAPEVLKTSYNEKCDVWSCGVIMFIMLYNRPPFDGIDD
jgi:calcium-dependent protein kinase